MTNPNVRPELTRPIIGIENRTAQEVFDMMCDRIRYAKVPDLIAHIERLEGLVEEAAGWFEQYAVEHYAKAKTAPDSGEQHGREVKGKTNRDRATYLRATLSQGTSHE
jgi:hypothetical protein